MPTTQQEKITSLFNKLPLEHKIETFNLLKENLTEQLVKAAQEAEETQNRLISLTDKINNGK